MSHVAAIGRAYPRGSRSVWGRRMFPLGSSVPSADYRHKMREQRRHTRAARTAGGGRCAAEAHPALADARVPGGRRRRGDRGRGDRLRRGPEPYVLFGIGIATLAAVIVSVGVRRPSRIWPWALIAARLRSVPGRRIAHSAAGHDGGPHRAAVPHPRPAHAARLHAAVRRAARVLAQRRPRLPAPVERRPRRLHRGARRWPPSAGCSSSSHAGSRTRCPSR